MANYYVTQTITIQKLSIGTINNSSVVQIGTAGLIRPQATLYNTGGFKGAAPQVGEAPSPTSSSSSPEIKGPSLVPLGAI